VNTRDSHLKRSYGISEAEYEAQAQSQNYLCSVCEQPNWVGHSGETKKLVVDHSHRGPGSNRGLLCDRCNKVLGFIRDSQELLFRLLEYLRKHDGSAIPYLPDNLFTRAAREAAWEASLNPEPLPANGENVGEIAAGMSEGLSECEQVRPRRV